ncbi:hypothetical protein G5I_11323 [Acromyrmex echinatior]|uniref:Uncharacterized protein n=1 Tax=Acromyrmex echinatior TaxID=103372 RepID=F4WZA8_ACREC|nr:hypothetical protein G5I_11323 [Acromyrmex echinatior]
MKSLILINFKVPVFYPPSPLFCALRSLSPVSRLRILSREFCGTSLRYLGRVPRTRNGDMNIPGVEYPRVVNLFGTTRMKKVRLRIPRITRLKFRKLLRKWSGRAIRHCPNTSLSATVAAGGMSLCKVLGNTQPLEVKRVIGAANARTHVLPDPVCQIPWHGVRSMPRWIVNRALTLVTRISPLSHDASARACRSGKRPYQADPHALKTTQIDFRGMSLMCRDHDITDEFEFPHELEILFETRKITCNPNRDTNDPVRNETTWIIHSMRPRTQATVFQGKSDFHFLSFFPFVSSRINAFDDYSLPEKNKRVSSLEKTDEKKTRVRKDREKKNGRKPQRKKLPSLVEEKKSGLLYLGTTDRPVDYIVEIEKIDTLPYHFVPLLFQSSCSPPREGDVKGVEKITDKETGKLRGRRNKGGNKTDKLVWLLYKVLGIPSRIR